MEAKEYVKNKRGLFPVLANWAVLDPFECNKTREADFYEERSHTDLEIIPKVRPETSKPINRTLENDIVLSPSLPQR